MSEQVFTSEEFLALPINHLEQHKFTLTVDWKVAIRVVWWIVSTNFLALTDTPASYTWNAGLFVKVNATETGLEYWSPAWWWDVVWPASSVANRIATFNWITGKLIQDGWNTIADLLARANHTWTQLASTISDFGNAVWSETLLHWVISIEDLVSLNTDTSKLDILATDYFINWVKYSYAGWTAIVPTIAATDTSTWVWLDSSWLIYSPDKFTTVQKLTILPLTRLQAVVWQSWPWSQLQTPVHLSYSIWKDGYIDSQWLLDVMWALYASWGTFSENWTTPLQVDQASWIFYNSQRKKINIIWSSNIIASEVYAVSWVTYPQADSTLVIPKYWDNWTDRVVLWNNKYASHTLLRSPKWENNFFLIYSDQEYNSLAEAQQAPIDYSIFADQATSTFIPVARFILKWDSANIIQIIDERPSLWWTVSAIIGTATIQQVYDNSTSPEILTDITRGAFSVKRGSAADTDCIFEWLNWAWTQTFCVTWNWAITANWDITANNLSWTNTWDQDLSWYSLTSHTHAWIYEPVFTKNTAFNKDFGTSAGTVLEWNTNVWIVWTKVVDEVAIWDTKMLAYNSTSGKLEYIVQPSGWSGWWICPVKIAWIQVTNTEFFEYIADGAKTVWSITIALQVKPVWQDFLVKTYKNWTLTDTFTIATTATLVKGRYTATTDIAESLVATDVFTAKITQVWTDTKWSEFSFVANIS